MHFLARSFSKSLKSSTTMIGQTCVLSQQFHSTIPTNSSTGRINMANPEPPSPPKDAAAERPWPREIPYQPKLANSVNLIGYVDQPVQFESFSDGQFWAGTVVSQRASSDSGSASDSADNLWIPIIFEGELAHTAACHLKKNDRIHIAGKLFVDSFPSSSNPGQANVQVMVHNLHYIDGSLSTKAFATSDQEGVLKHSVNLRKSRDVRVDCWRDLLDKPEEWWDYRASKQNELVKPRHPDFKKKDGSLSLWLDDAPNWVSSDLEGVKFETPVSKPRQAKQRNGDESWEDLAANPDKWWDNRLDKRHERSPDFKHKETGVALWLSDCPSWLISKLPPPKGKLNSSTQIS